MHERLNGGVNGVWRIGSEVIRPRYPWTPNVHGLLRYLEQRAMDEVPRVIRLNETTERLTFIPGAVSNYPLSPAVATVPVLVSAARLLRRFHDLTADYVSGHMEGWQLPAQSRPEVLCHGDFAPFNVVVHNGQAVGLIDFDTVHPGSRVWDVAYAVYRWATLTAPSNPDGFGQAREQSARARRFCDAYGLSHADRNCLISILCRRLEALIAFMLAKVAEGDSAFIRHVEEGPIRIYETDLAYLRSNKDALTTGLVGHKGHA